jgi:hypothetical protein
MAMRYASVLAPLVLASALATSGGQTPGKPETVVVQDGPVVVTGRSLSELTDQIANGL